jgi:uncharacterized NAD-dependent epimerase/dehydratase family protein
VDGKALIYCEGAFGRPEGKVTHGLLRFGRRYQVVGVIDSACAGRNATEMLIGVRQSTPIFASLAQAMQALEERPDYLVMGLATADGRLPAKFRAVVADAINRGINVDSALRPYLTDDPEFPGLAMMRSVRLRAVGYPKPWHQLHEYTGAIEQVRAIKVVIIGTHPVVGKRTTAVQLTEELRRREVRTEFIGTGTTSWFQGVRHTVIVSSILRKFVAGEVEHEIVEAWRARSPEVFIVEGRGSLTHGAQPMPLELITTVRPTALVMQHASHLVPWGEADPDGVRLLVDHIRAAETISGAPVIAVTLNNEGCEPGVRERVAASIGAACGLPVTDVFVDGPGLLADVVLGLMSGSVGAGGPPA